MLKAILLSLLISGCLAGGVAYVPEGYYGCEYAAVRTAVCDPYYVWVPGHYSWPYDVWHPGHYDVRPGWRRPPMHTYAPYPVVRDHHHRRR